LLRINLGVTAKEQNINNEEVHENDYFDKPHAILRNDDICDGGPESENDDEPLSDNEAVVNNDILNDVEAEEVIALDLSNLSWNECELKQQEEDDILHNRRGTSITPTTPVGVPLSFITGVRKFSGVKMSSPKRHTPASLYKLYYTDDLMQEFVDNTNSDAQNIHIRRWVNIDIEELHRFHMILLLLGINCPPERRMAWEDPVFQIPLVKSIMKRVRFEQIMKAWHWIDMSSLSDTELKRRNVDNPFWTVDSLIYQFTQVAMSSYTPRHALSLDE
jgi:hypothetical protein